MAGLSVLMPYGYSASSCGYCSPPGQRSASKSSVSYGMLTQHMSPRFYQDLIDRGWRRSGIYTYHPDMERTCCPQYAIRLDAGAFKPSRHQRGAVNRWNRFLSTGLKPGETGDDPMEGGKDGKAKGSAKGKGKAKPFELAQELRAHQVGYGEGKHRFELGFTPAEATPETFVLYKKYQMSVHKDPEHKATMSGFKNFLCGSPLSDDTIPYREDADTTHLPKTYGSYHLLYRVDGEIVGISVIDVLPTCVSSVYFIWDPDWAWAGLGKLSALYEIGLVRDMAAAGAPGMGWLYMGFWIATCQKMRYKGEYTPSYLLDPGTNEWHLLSPTLDKYLAARRRGYIPFKDIEALSADELAAVVPNNTDMSAPPAQDTEDESDDSDAESDRSEGSVDWPSPPPPSFADPDSVTEDTLDDLLVLSPSAGQLRIIPYMAMRARLPWVEESVRQLAAAVGTELLASVEREDYRTRGLLFLR